MGILKHFDIFKSLKSNAENQSKIGFILSLIVLILIPYIIIKETWVYKNQFLETKLVVEHIYKEKIPVFLDITVFKMPCESIELIYNNSIIENVEKITVDLKKKSKLKSCRLISNFEINTLDGRIQIIPSGDLQILGQIFGSNQLFIDMSHKINKLEFGKSFFDYLFQVNKNLLKSIDPTPLNGVIMKEKTKYGHSLFLYDVEIIPIKYQDILNDEKYIYHSNKNSIVSQNINPFINIKLSVSSYQIEYMNSQMNMLDLLSNIIGMIGGTIAIVKIIDKVFISIF